MGAVSTNHVCQVLDWLEEYDNTVVCNMLNVFASVESYGVFVANPVKVGDDFPPLAAVMSLVEELGLELYSDIEALDAGDDFEYRYRWFFLPEDCLPDGWEPNPELITVTDRPVVSSLDVLS